MKHSGRGLEAAIQHSASLRAVLGFLTPPLVLYYAYSTNYRAITTIYSTSIKNYGVTYVTMLHTHYTTLMENILWPLLYIWRMMVVGNLHISRRTFEVLCAELRTSIFAEKNTNLWITIWQELLLQYGDWVQTQGLWWNSVGHMWCDW